MAKGEIAMDDDKEKAAVERALKEAGHTHIKVAYRFRTRPSDNSCEECGFELTKFSPSGGERSLYKARLKAWVCLVRKESRHFAIVVFTEKVGDEEENPAVKLLN